MDGLSRVESREITNENCRGRVKGTWAREKGKRKWEKDKDKRVKWTGVGRGERKEEKRI